MAGAPGALHSQPATIKRLRSSRQLHQLEQPDKLDTDQRTRHKLVFHRLLGRWNRIGGDGRWRRDLHFDQFRRHMDSDQRAVEHLLLLSIPKFYTIRLVFHRLLGRWNQTGGDGGLGVCTGVDCGPGLHFQQFRRHLEPGQEQSTGGGLPNWTSIASSADGTKMAAVESSAGICTSTNSGDTWAQTSAPSAAWSSIASSADGTQLAATVDGGVNDGGGIYTSTNSGGTWTQTSAPGSGPFDRVGWSSIASSADGTKLAAVVNNRGGIYTSTNSGGTWTQTSAPSTDWSSIASSADGIKLAAVVLSGGIYTSTDSGVTWNQTSAPGAGWLSIASSADGTRLAAVVDGGGIWTAQATIQTTQTTPGLTITPSGGSIIVSWPYPSSGFILQQNDDLSTDELDSFQLHHHH